MRQLLTVGRQRIPGRSPRYIGNGTWAMLPAKARIGDRFDVIDTLLGVSGIWPFEFDPNNDATLSWKIAKGATAPCTYVDLVHDAINNAPNGWVQDGSVVCPAIPGAFNWDVAIGGSTVQQGVAAQIQAALSTGNTAAPSGTTIATATSASSGLGALGAHDLSKNYTSTASQVIYIHRYGSANGEGGLVVVRCRPVKVQGLA